MKTSFVRSAIAMLAGALLSSQACAEAQNVVIGVTKIVAHAALDADEKGFEAGLASGGFKEGVNITYDRQNAQGDMAKAQAIAQKFIDQKVDLIHAIATPTTQTVQKLVKNIPVVFSSITDPVSAGIVPKDSAPGKLVFNRTISLKDTWAKK